MLAPSKQRAIYSILMGMGVLALFAFVAFMDSSLDDAPANIKMESQTDLVKRAKAVMKDDWLPSGDPEETVINHQDDKEVKEAAKKNDLRYGVMTKTAEKHDIQEVVKESNEVQFSMKKALQDRRIEKRKEKRDRADTTDFIKELYNEAYHKKKVNERRAKKRKVERAEKAKKLKAFKREKRVKILYKRNCKVLARIMESANPKQAEVYRIAARC